MSWRKPVTVYNASNTNILARVSSDSITENQKGIALGKFSKGTVDKFDQSTKTGFSVVQRFSRVEFSPEKAKDTAYVSIKPNDTGKGKYMYLCQDHPVKGEGYGVIVTQNFYIRNAKDEWKDIDGVDHKPPKKANKTGPEPTGLNFLATNDNDLEITCSTTANGNDYTGCVENSSAE